MKHPSYKGGCFRCYIFITGVFVLFQAATHSPSLPDTASAGKLSSGSFLPCIKGWSSMWSMALGAEANYTHDGYLCHIAIPAQGLSQAMNGSSRQIWACKLWGIALRDVPLSDVLWPNYEESRRLSSHYFGKSPPSSPIIYFWSNCE